MASLTKVTQNRRNKRDSKKQQNRKKKTEAKIRKREREGELLVR